MHKPRKKPYTDIGVHRVPCVRCGAPSTDQWSICSDGNQFRGICKACDIALNETVLRFVGFHDWKSKIKAYRSKVEVT